MKLRGGYNIRLAGRPAGRIEDLPEPSALLLPQRSRRLRFTQLLVKNGQRVRAGEALALAPEQFALPLLAPRSGTVRLRAQRGHVVLEDLAQEPPHLPPEPPAGGEVNPRRQWLIDLGAWPFLHDAHSDAVPDPQRPARAAIVATTHLEPFAVRGDVQLRESLEEFLRGLELLASLVEETVFVAVPRSGSELAARLRQGLAGKERIRAVEIPLRYPLDHFNVLARALGLRAERSRSVWGLRTEGVLAIDQALTLRRPVVDRVVSVGGSGVTQPVHLRAPRGYPVEAMLAGRLLDRPVRVIDGGILNGEAVGPRLLGLGVESTGLTVLLEPAGRELFGFVRTGLDRISYSRCFLSVFRGKYVEPMTTAVRGEHRPCIACGFCEELCPAGIMPHLIHKLAYQDALEEIDRCGSLLCVGCGLCTYVCPSKLELRREILAANETIVRDLHAEAPEQTEEAPA
jgi:Na+-transporting NADH:ubiquinone oxidoreductase subunit A